MPPVFAHGRLRLYLLKLLEEAPRHGYEVIRLLEERFQGRYAPSAGTVYPRLAKLETEGLVSHTSEGGRKVYALTDAGCAELSDRQGELAELELEIHESLAALAADTREDVRGGSARDARREGREATRSDRRGTARPGGRPGGPDGPEGESAPGAEHTSWQTVREDLRRARDGWREQARRARDESRRAQQEARHAKEEARRIQREAQEEIQRIAQQVQEQVQAHAQAGDWPGAMRAGMSELAREMGSLSRVAGPGTSWPPFFQGSGGQAENAAAEPPGPEHGKGRTADGDLPGGAGAAAAGAGRRAPRDAAGPAEAVPDPARELERLLDRFRDDVRDDARDYGVTPQQLREARRLLSTTAAQLAALLRVPDEPRRPRN